MEWLNSYNNLGDGYCLYSNFRHGDPQAQMCQNLSWVLDPQSPAPNLCPRGPGERFNPERESKVWTAGAGAELPPARARLALPQHAWGEPPVCPLLSSVTWGLKEEMPPLPTWHFWSSIFPPDHSPTVCKAKGSTSLCGQSESKWRDTCLKREFCMSHTHENDGLVNDFFILKFLFFILFFIYR